MQLFRVRVKASCPEINLPDEHKRRDMLWLRAAGDFVVFFVCERWGGVGVAPRYLSCAHCWVLIRVFIYIHLCVCALHIIFFVSPARIMPGIMFARRVRFLALRCVWSALPLGRRRRRSRSFSTPAHSFFWWQYTQSRRPRRNNAQESAPLNTRLIPSYIFHSRAKRCARGATSKSDGFQFFTLDGVTIG